MESILKELSNDSFVPKFNGIKRACLIALESLDNFGSKDGEIIGVCEIRQQCLNPLQLAIESRSIRLASHGISGIEMVLKDERFHSTMECEDEEQWLPLQVLRAVSSLPHLMEDTQIHVSKILLNMTYTSVWCMNAKVITSITELLIKAISCNRGRSVVAVFVDALLNILSSYQEHCVTYQQSTVNTALDLLRSEQSCSCQYSVESFELLVSTYPNSSSIVRTAVDATMSQMITNFVDTLVQDGHHDAMSKPQEILMDVDPKETLERNREKLCQDVVHILQFLIQKLKTVPHVGTQTKTMVPLLLQGVFAVLHNTPRSLSNSTIFTDLLWQELCPTLVYLLGNPVVDEKSLTNKYHDELGRGSGCSTAAPVLPSFSAKIIYSISVELVRLVGNMASMRTVLESLFHRMLLYNPPQHRLDALKALKEIFCQASYIVDLIAPTCDESVDSNGLPSKISLLGDQSLIKLMVDALQECCHCNESPVCIISVQCIDHLLGSLEQLCVGEGLTDDTARILSKKQMAVEKAIEEVDRQRNMTTCTRQNREDSPRHSITDNLHILKTCVKEAREHNMGDLKHTDSDDGSDDVFAEEVILNDQSDSYSSDDNDEHVMVGDTTRTMTEGEMAERQNARNFGACLQKALPAFLAMGSILDVDGALQRFASTYCNDMVNEATDGDETKLTPSVILNADGVYMASIFTLWLNVRLAQTGFYSESHSLSPAVSETEFIDSVLDNGLLLFLSPTWLSEVYRFALVVDLVSVAGYDHGCIKSCGTPLINFVLDIDGLGGHGVGDQFLSDQWSSSFPTRKPSVDKLKRDAGKKICRQTLTACWERVIDILSVLVNGSSSCGITSSLGLMLGMDGAREETMKARQAVCTALDGLQKAARLCCTLGLQSLCGRVFAELASTSCIMEELIRIPVVSDYNSHNRPKPIRLHAAHVLSMDILITSGLEMGSHSVDCWRHIFRCCAHVSGLEHRYFSSHNSVTQKSRHEQTSDFSQCAAPDYIHSRMSSHLATTPAMNIPEFIRQSSIESGWDQSITGGGVLTVEQTSKALCGLSQEVDRLFEESARYLNVQSLMGFLTELCASSLDQLRTYGDLDNTRDALLKLPPNALHLYRLQETLVRILSSGRPLVHLLRTWTVTSPYLVEAAGHSDRAVSKMAVSCIHSYVTYMLHNHTELPHFHSNELLCKTFEKLLCLELCDGDVQDQVVCSICELVEACACEIRSGWRPLFAALKSVKIEYTTSEEVNEARQHHVTAVLDVFDVFLSTDNVLVFAYATVDCILCLLKYVRGPGAFHDGYNSDSDSDSDVNVATVAPDSLCIPALKYLHQCCKLLATMWNMPACPSFNGAYRQSQLQSSCVDPNISNMDFRMFEDQFYRHSPSRRVSKSNYSKDLAGMVGVKESASRDGKGDDGVIDENGEHHGEKVNDEGKEDVKNESSIEGRSDVYGGGVVVRNVEVGEDGKVGCNGLDKDSDGDQDGGYNEGRRKGVRVSEGGENAAESDVSLIPGDEGVISPDTKVASCNFSMELCDHEGDVAAVSNESTRSDEIDASRRKSDASQVTNDINTESKNNTTVENNTTHETTTEQMNLNDFDNGTGVLHVWFMLLEGLASSISLCPKSFQPQCLDTLFMMLRDTIDEPGPDFSMYCVNHLILPMLQSWLRKCTAYYGYWDGPMANFKHCCGLCTDLVVEYIVRFVGKNNTSEHLVDSMLKQLLDVLIECISQPVETISRLGCSCLRHALLSCGPLLSEKMWQTAVASLQRALDVSTFSLRQVMLLFHASSDNFYGDVGQVKVATRKDTTVMECQRLQHLAQQVFLLPNQVSDTSHVIFDTDADKSYVFLLYRPHHKDSLNPEHILARVPFHSIVVGLLSHQLILQTIAHLLLHGSTNSVIQSKLQMASSPGVDNDATPQRSLPGLLQRMSVRNIATVLTSLLSSYNLACDFDTRPGLKFLFQKVARTEVAANLYKQAGLAMTVYTSTVVEICSLLSDNNLDTTRDVLHDSPFSRSVDVLAESARCLDPLTAHLSMFLRLLYLMWTEVSQTYVDLVLDKHGAAVMDRIDQRPLFFLAAQPDDLFESTCSDKWKKLIRQRLMEDPTFPLTSEMDRMVDDVASVMSEDTQPPSPDRQRSKRQSREERESRIYTVASDRTVKSLISQYKKHKQRNTMPSFVKLSHKKKDASKKEAKTARKEVLTPEIESQQQSSTLKDSEAHVQCWSELLTTTLQLYQQLPDHTFLSLLPAGFHAINQLVCHTDDPGLKEELGRWLHRLGHQLCLSLNEAPSHAS